MWYVDMCAGMRFAGPSWGPLLAGSPAPRLPLKSRRPAGRADFLAPLSLFAWLLLRLIQGWITIRILKRSCRALPFQTSCCTSSLLSSSPLSVLLYLSFPAGRSSSNISVTLCYQHNPLTARRRFLSHIYSPSLVCICGLSDVWTTLKRHTTL